MRPSKVKRYPGHLQFISSEFLQALLTCSHVLSSHYLRFARNPDNLLPTFQRLCFLGPGLTLFLVSRMPTNSKHCGKVELCTGPGARQLCDLGQITFSRQGGQTLSCSVLSLLER